MSDAIIVAVITGTFSLIGQMFIVKNQNSKTCSSVDERLSLSDKNTEKQLLGIKKEIDLLSARIDRHNGFGEKMSAVQDQIQGIKDKLDALENK